MSKPAAAAFVWLCCNAKPPPKSAASFPIRAYIQKFDEVPPDYELVANELKTRGIPVIYKRTEDIVRKNAAAAWQLTKDDLVVGNFEWTRLALQRLAIPMPQPPDYPECLKKLLHRRVWQSTLGEVQAFLRKPENSGTSVFIKPAATAKAFAAIVEPRDQMLDTLIEGIPDVMEGLPRSTPIHCSELVDMISEFRVYVVDGVARSICQYRGPKAAAGSPQALDLNVVNDAIRTLTTSDEGKDLTGCGVDFAVLKVKGKGEGASESYVTCLVEVNDGFSLGRYEGLSGKDYTDLLIARWARVVGAHVAPSVSDDSKVNKADGAARAAVAVAAPKAK